MAAKSAALASANALQMTIPQLATFKRDARLIFLSAVHAVQPDVLMRKNLHVINDQCHFKVGCSDAATVFEPHHNVYVCGMGKAVAPMARQLQELLWPHIQKGIISVPDGFTHLSKSLDKTWLPRPPIEVMEGAKDNMPDENSMRAAQKIVEMAESLTKSDILFVLLSGGGSALAPLPKPPMSLAEKQHIVRTLSRAGASIEELNAVRTRLSALKGGQLLGRTRAQVISLILSDIVGSPLHLIASGPTVVQPGKSGDLDDPIKILGRYGVPMTDKLAEVLGQQHLHPGGESRAASVHNYLIGSNLIALEAARMAAEVNGYHAIIASDRLRGEAREVGRHIARLATQRDSSNLDLSPEVRTQLDSIPAESKVCVLFGGETTVTVTGSGLGGRNQELALAAAFELEGHPKDVVLLSAGTDGIDGPTDAAGAAVDPRTIAEHRQEQDSAGRDAASFLSNNDSYHFFEGKHDAHVKIGHTGTNVMDLQVLMFDTSTKDVGTGTDDQNSAETGHQAGGASS